MSSSSSSHSAKCTYHFGSVISGSVSADNLYLDKGSVTQATSIITGVTLPKPVGLIRTVTSTLGPLSSTQFKAQHSSIKSDSILFASVGAYSGDGIPYVNVVSYSAGSSTISISNLSTGGSLTQPVTIAYQIL
jgi:hypothetical protein